MPRSCGGGRYDKPLLLETRLSRGDSSVSMDAVKDQFRESLLHVHAHMYLHAKRQTYVHTYMHVGRGGMGGGRVLVERESPLGSDDATTG